MSKLKVYMAESWYTYRNSHTIEIGTDDYEELKGMSDEEAFEYLSENMCVKDADIQKINHILDKVKLNHVTQSSGQID